MGAFNTHNVITTDPDYIPAMADKIISHFKEKGYEVDSQVSDTGAYDISVTKGGVFRVVLGLKTALKINIKPYVGKVSFDAGVGIFGQQLIPAIITYFVAWPVILTQIWGIIKQSRLDNIALELAESVVPAATAPALSEPDPVFSFCSNCGTRFSPGMKYCVHCGVKL
jgi:hypothetical protein